MTAHLWCNVLNCRQQPTLGRMGTLQERRDKEGNTSWRAQVRLSGFPAQSATFKRKTDARKWIQDTEAGIRAGRHFPTHEARKHTLAALIDRYAAQVQLKNPKAYPKQAQILGWWKERLGAYALSNLTPALIAEQRDALMAENIGTKARPAHRGPATANRYLAALSKAYTIAVQEWHWLSENPLRQVRKESEPQGIVRYLDDDERSRLLKACSASTDLQLAVTIGITTGMRKGEIRSLRWADVDLDRKVAILHKTKNSERRAVPLVPDTLRLLRARAKGAPDELVFPHRKGGKPMDFDKAFAAAVKAAGIEHFRFHDLRHTCASYLAMTGATTAEIAAVLGHKTLAMVKRYAHLSDQHTSSVLERMNKKFGM